MEPVASWFKRELRTVDERYYVETDEREQLYRIMMKADTVVYSPMYGTKAKRIIAPKVVDVFRRLNDDALLHLRYRKHLGRQMKILEKPNAEWNYLQAQEKAAKVKEMNLAHEMIADGMMEAYRVEHKHTVS